MMPMLEQPALYRWSIWERHHSRGRGGLVPGRIEEEEEEEEEEDRPQ
jgi:hypothetical protein